MVCNYSFWRIYHIAIGMAVGLRDRDYNPQSIQNSLGQLTFNNDILLHDATLMFELLDILFHMEHYVHILL